MGVRWGQGYGPGMQEPELSRQQPVLGSWNTNSICQVWRLGKI